MNKERLTELQKTADEAKYLKGWEEQYDPSGDMPFCDYCEHCVGKRCVKPYGDRVNQFCCGKAYAKYIDAELESIIGTKGE